MSKDKTIKGNGKNDRISPANDQLGENSGTDVTAYRQDRPIAKNKGKR